MYSLSNIQSNFFTNKLITFKNSLNSDTPVLSSDLTGQSKSKRYFNVGTHGLISLENIDKLLPLTDDFTITAYAAGTTYTNFDTDFKLSNVVSASDKYYISIANANQGNAVSETAWWKETTLLSLLLKDKIRGAIENVISDIVQPNFIESNEYLYRVADLTDDVITTPATGKWVGYRIFPVSSEHLLFIINQVALQFTDTETDLTFKLYNQNTEISTFDLTATGGRFQWQDITQLELTSNSGAWYLFYDQNDLTGDAIGDDCLFTNYFYEYAHITPFECAVGTDLNTIDTDDFVTDKNFGINLNFSISYDLTDFLKQHETMFAEAYQLQFVYNMLDLFVNNPDARSNLNQRNIDIDNTLYELKNYDGHTIIRRLRSAQKQLRASFQKLSYKDSAFETNDEDDYLVGTI